MNFAIVGSGPNAASPHHEAGARVIGRGETVVCDFGGTLHVGEDIGYCSDITRTWASGEGAIASTYAHLVDSVEKMQQRLCAAIAIGTPYEKLHDESHRRQVLAALERALAGDRAQTHIVSLSPLGLVEMTRKRTRESLEHLLCAPCPTCEGRGFVKTPETVCNEIFREIVRQSRQFASRELLILAHQDVVDCLLDEEASAMAELESQIGRPIRLQAEALYGVDQYDVVLI